MASVQLSQTLPFRFARDTQTAWRRALVTGLAVCVSVSLHFGMPFVRFPQAKPAKSRMVVELMRPPPPIPVPVAEEEIIAPPSETTGPAPPADAPAPPVDAPADVEDMPDAPDDAPAEAAPSDTPPDDSPPEETTLPEVAPEGAVRVSRAEQLAQRIADRKARLEAMRKAADEARKQRAAAGGGGAPLTALDPGDPEAVFLCEGTSRGRQVRVTAERPLTSWITVVPTAIVGFDTRPGIGDYLDDIGQVLQREKNPKARLGHVEFALPAQPLQFDLDAPRGVRISLGRTDGRCLVGLKYTRQLFPLTMKRVPLRMVDKRNDTVDALVDVEFYKDASFKITALDGTELPFSTGRIKNSRVIATNIEDHFQAARLAKAVAGFFGIDLKKALKDRGTGSGSRAVDEARAAERLRKVTGGGSTSPR